MAAEPNGASTSETVTSMSSNPILAVSGVYFQDFYYDPACTAQGHEYLDEHDGHTDDERGYHYHTALTQTAGGELDFAFPHYIDSTFAGQLPDDAIASCGGNGGGFFSGIFGQ